jgi:hypothetical protein
MWGEMQLLLQGCDGAMQGEYGYRTTNHGRNV